MQEVISLFKNKHKKKGLILLKIDLEKAFDRLEWSFIRETILYLGFLTNFIKIIMSCITTSEITILVNGGRTNFFKPSKGIR